MYWFTFCLYPLCCRLRAILDKGGKGVCKQHNTHIVVQPSLGYKWPSPKIWARGGEGWRGQRSDSSRGCVCVCVCVSYCHSLKQISSMTTTFLEEFFFAICHTLKQAYYMHAHGKFTSKQLMLVLPTSPPLAFYPSLFCYKRFSRGMIEYFSPIKQWFSVRLVPQN